MAKEFESALALKTSGFFTVSKAKLSIEVVGLRRSHGPKQSRNLLRLPLTHVHINHINANVARVHCNFSLSPKMPSGLSFPCKEGRPSFSPSKCSCTQTGAFGVCEIETCQQSL